MKREVFGRNFIVDGFKYLIIQHQFSENFQNAMELIRKKLPKYSGIKKHLLYFSDRSKRRIAALT